MENGNTSRGVQNRLTEYFASASAARGQSLLGQGSLFEVASDVACLQLSIVNVYFCGEAGAADRSWALVDAGLAFSEESIVRAAAERFGENSRPAAILLTHGHFDHVGALPALADRWEAPIYAHAMEMPYLTGRSSYPPPDPTVSGGAMAMLSRLYPRGPYHFGDRMRTLPADGSVPGMPQWRWIHTPGHTPGHVSFFREADRLLIAGDAFVTTRQESLVAVMTQKQEVRRPPAYYTPDWVTARRSVETLAALRPNIAATGHGLPMHGESMRQELDRLAREWDRLAVPAYGRYVRQPAVADENGVVWIPDPVADPNLPALLGVGAAAALGALLLAGWASSSSRRTLS